jgi:putative ubiquitin-RnfH superfamily antitoxin RatB of RatAB toxin-antitoxin module
LTVEVVYARVDVQERICVVLPVGSTVRAAIEQSGIATLHPEVIPAACDAGVFGRRRSLDDLLRHGDRVEIYRPLQADPKEARRSRVARNGSRGKKG